MFKRCGCAALMAFGLCAASPTIAQESAEPTPKELFERTCSACHPLALPTSQRLDRSNWEWVVSDMVEQFGCNLTVEEERAKIIDYLVENYGPQK